MDPGLIDAYAAAAVRGRRKKMERIVRRVHMIAGDNREAALLEMKDGAIEAIILAHRHSNVLLGDLLEDKSYPGTRASHIRANQCNFRRCRIVAARLALLLPRLDPVRLNAVEHQDAITMLIHGDSDAVLTKSLMTQGLKPFAISMAMSLPFNTLKWLLEQGFVMRFDVDINFWCSKTSMKVKIPQLWTALHSLETVKLVIEQLCLQNIKLETQYTSADPNLLGCTILHSFHHDTYTDTSSKIVQWLFTAAPMPPPPTFTHDVPSLKPLPFKKCLPMGTQAQVDRGVLSARWWKRAPISLSHGQS
jgi:hypothetical protein